MCPLFSRRDVPRLSEAAIESARGILWQTAAVVFAAEFLVMQVLRGLGFDFTWVTAMFDSLLLCIFALPLLYLAILRPVVRLTARQAAEAAQARFETVAEAVGDGVLVHNAGGQIEFANGALEEMLGYERGELVGAPVKSLMADEVVPLFRGGYQQFPHSGEDGVMGRGPFETYGKRKNGQRFPVEITVSSLSVGPETRFVVLLRDITERMRAAQALTDSERRLRAVFEALPVAVRIIQDGKVTFANAADARLFGYARPDQEIGIDALAHIADPDRQRLTDYALRRAAGLGAPELYEARIRRTDGADLPVEITATCFTHDGAPASLLVLRDLSDRARRLLYETILPVCSVCGRIRDDSHTEPGKGTWGSLEEYVQHHSAARISHTFCPECLRDYAREQGITLHRREG